MSSAFPSNVDPSRGIFVFHRVNAIAQIPGVSVRVISPTPWAPSIRSVPKFSRFSQLPAKEVFQGIPVYRPRYLLPPKIGGYVHPRLMYGSLLRAATKIRKEFDFDLLDAHWVYPCGVAATRLSRQLNVPVCVTGRGEDMMRFPSYPLKGRSIRWALRNAEVAIGVSQEISQAMVDNGASVDRVMTIANGVDIDRFRPLSKQTCRERLGLPADRRILLTVGDQLELKGFHVVISALPKILEQHPDVVYVGVGGPGRHGRDFSKQIRETISQLRLEDQVRMVGAQSHDELVHWYNSADLYVMASSREGSPNVLLEALACGTPAVATPVGGANDELVVGRTGVIMSQRTPDAAAEAICQAFSTKWDCSSIRRIMEDRSWGDTANRVMEHINSLVPSSVN
ncbi:MAG: glycosyltransferase [Planctomycetales bacterium]|nr:glycosyltransferase [Planctomycetales bacterium]